MIQIVQPVNEILENEIVENEIVENEVLPAVEPVPETVTGEHFEMTQEQYDLLVTYFEIETGALMELTWIVKAFMIMFIILQAWRLVRK